MPMRLMWSGIVLITCVLCTSVCPGADPAPQQPAPAAGSKGAAADLLAKARGALRRGDADAAAALAEKAVAAEPDNPECYQFRAGLYELRGDLEKAVGDYDRVAELRPEDIRVYQQRGVAQFRLGRPEAAVRDFDKYLELQPEQRPYHWQRGIALYYAGRYEDGARQFEEHQTVNRHDVENAVWHYLCVARARGVDEAKASLIPIAGDTRVPMAQVHDLFAGKAKPEDVLAAADAGAEDVPPAERKDRRFYAHLYLALYFEAQGDKARVKEHIDTATSEYAMPHYMGDVARVHAKLLGRKKGKDEAEK